MISRTEFFMELLRGTTGRIELRRMIWNPGNGKYNNQIHGRLFSRSIHELERFFRNDGGDVFHGVNLRGDGDNGAKGNISEIICAAADIDFQDTPQKKVDKALVSIVQPTILINSANGYHAYWLLETPLTATGENINLIEGINKGLAKRLGGDYCHDVTRILRTPGRKNSKYADGRMCEIVRAGGPRYSIEHLRQFHVQVENDVPKVEIGNGGDGDLPEKFRSLLAKNKSIQKIWHGDRPDLKDPTRSGYDMTMANTLVGFGFLPQEIALVLHHMPSGKGGEAGRTYLERTIGKAWKNRAEKEEINEQEATDGDTGEEKPLIEIMENIVEEDVDWLWNKRIARGKLTLFDGDPEIGKSITSLKIAASLSRGEALPFDKEPEAPLRSLIISAEDAPADTLKPRLAKLGADMTLIAVPRRDLDVSLKADFLEQLLKQWPAAYCVIDPIIAFARGKNTDRAGDVRTLLGPIVHVAEEHNIAIVLIRHLNKNLGASALYRGQGSMDFPAICRSVFTFAVDPKSPGRRLMAQTKNSLAQKQRTLEFFIDENGVFSWGEESDETADEILGEAKKRTSEQLETAKAFLIETLINGWALSTKVEEMAGLKGISKRTLWRAKTELQIKARRVQGEWWWTLT